MRATAFSHFFRSKKEKARNHFLSERFFTSPYLLERTKDNNRFSNFFGPLASVFNKVLNTILISSHLNSYY